MNVPDVYDLRESHEAEKERMLDALPECEICGVKIQADFYYEVNDSILCERCMIENHRKITEDFIS